MNDKAERAQSAKEMLGRIYAGILQRHGLPNGKGQYALALKILDALLGGKILMADAGEGDGGIHAYIAASILAAQAGANDFNLRSFYPLSRGFHIDTPMPVAVSVPGRAAQNALAKEHIPQISGIMHSHRITPEPVSCAIRKGKGHYLCRRRLGDYLHGAKDENAKAVLDKLRRSPATLDLDRIDALPASVKRKICAGGGCGRDCRLRHCCPYMRYAADAGSYRHGFQVCSHGFLLADIMRRRDGAAGLLPNYQAVVIDDVRKFMSAARQAYSYELSILEIPRLVGRLSAFMEKGQRASPSVGRSGRQLEKHNAALFKMLLKGLPAENGSGGDAKRRPAKIGVQALSALHGIYNEASGIARHLSEMGGKPNEPQKKPQSRLIREFTDLAMRAGASGDTETIDYWLEMPMPARKPMGDTILHCSPKNLGELLSRDIWRNPYPVILLSRASPTAGDAGRMKALAGLNLVPGRRLMDAAKDASLYV